MDYATRLVAHLCISVFFLLHGSHRLITAKVKQIKLLPHKIHARRKTSNSSEQAGEKWERTAVRVGEYINSIIVKFVARFRLCFPLFISSNHLAPACIQSKHYAIRELIFGVTIHLTPNVWMRNRATQNNLACSYKSHTVCHMRCRTKRLPLDSPVHIPAHTHTP